MSVRIEPVDGLLFVDAASTASLTLSGLQTVDTVVLTAGMLCLAKNQASAQSVYQVQAGAWVPVDPGLGFGASVCVRGGSQAGSVFRCTTLDPIVWGTTAATFITAGTGGSAFDPTVPGPIGGTTPAAATFTTLAATSRFVAPSIGPDSSHQFTLPAVPSSTVLVSGASSSTDQSLQVGDSTHRWAALSVLTLNSGNLGGTLLANTTDGTTDSSWTVSEGTALATGGAGILYLATGGTNSVGGLKFACPSLGQTDALCEAELLLASGTVTAGQSVVWSGLKKVAAAAASANLTTIAGIALTSATVGNPVLIARRGRCYANADAGITAGMLLGTSGAVAGNVLNSTPTLGALLGRACEATAGTVAGKVLVDLILG